MKHIKKYNQFVNEGRMPNKYNVIDKATGEIVTDQPLKKDLAKKFAAKKKGWVIKAVNESVINEAHGDPIRTMEKVKSYLESEGEEVSARGSHLSIDLPKQINALPPKYNKIIKNVIKMSEGNMVAVKEATGYYMGNSLAFIFPVYQARLRKAYHVASAQYVDTILQRGLEPRSAQEHSNEFGSSLGNKNMEQTYKAAFVVGSKKGVKIVQDLFDIKDPVVLEIDPKGIQFWEDPLMPKDAKSALTFQTIPADRIKRL